MVTREDALKFTSTYEGNEQKLRDWNEALLEEQEPAEWIRTLSKRARDIRRIFAENVEALEHFHALLSVGEGSSYTKEDADTLFDIVLELYKKGFHDYTIIGDIAEKILPFYESSNDFGRIVFLYHVIGYEYSLFYRYDPTRDLSGAVRFFRHAVDNASHYAEITDPYYRSFILKDYANLFYIPKKNIAETLAGSLDVYNEVSDFFSSKAVNEDAENRSLRDTLIEQFRSSLLEYCVFKKPLSPSERKVVEKLVTETEQSKKNDNPSDLSAFIGTLYCKYLTGSIVISEVVDSLIDKLTETRPKTNYSKRSTDQQLILISYLGSISETLELIGFADISSERKAELTKPLKETRA